MCGMWCCHLACIWGELKNFDTKFLHSVWASASQIVSLRKLTRTTPQPSQINGTFSLVLSPGSASFLFASYSLFKSRTQGICRYLFGEKYLFSAPILQIYEDNRATLCRVSFFNQACIRKFYPRTSFGLRSNIVLWLNKPECSKQNKQHTPDGCTYN